MTAQTQAGTRTKRSAWRKMKKCWQLYIVILLPLLYIAIFHYAPMYGIQIAFRDYDVYEGILGSKWVGFDNFERFITNYKFLRIVRNTVTLSLYSLIAGMPIPIILAISLNECGSRKYKKLVQTVTYAPHFISTVVMVSMLIMFLSLNNGMLNNLIAFFGGTRTNFMAEPSMFKSIYVFSGIWQGMGYSSIIYLAALTSVDPTLYEAALIDGATRLQKIWYIDLPSILPTIVIILIMNVGQLMNVGFEKIYLMQNDLNITSSEIIATYVYKLGIERADFSYSTAISLFNSVINLLLLITVNQIARKVGETSLF